jgi:hypothetical protein
MRHQPRTSTTIVLVVALSTALLAAPTKVTPPTNKYTPAEDVRLGAEAAEEAERQLPVMKNDAITSYIERIGEDLVGALPNELRHPGFRYTFKVVNVREINAFALPGGPMFLNRGMIEAAHTEGEMASVMAHEISHVALRHGTAQASKATKYGIGQLAGAVLGAVIGGNLGMVVSQGTQFGLGTAFLRFSREYERQADILGAQIMARAGYDPRGMADMFKTIAKEGGASGPEWLNSHPNPSNRQNAILKEAESIQVERPIRDSGEFERVKARLGRMSPAPTTEQAIRDAARRGGGGAGTNGSRDDNPPRGRVEPPSSQYTRYEKDEIRVAVPSNWRELRDGDTVTFAPVGGYGSLGGENVFTHGVLVGAVRNQSGSLQTATDELVDSFVRGNPDLNRVSGYREIAVDGRRGLLTTMTNINEASGEPEHVQLVTAAAENGQLIYLIGVAPRDEINTYRSVFNRIIDSIELPS